MIQWIFLVSRQGKVRLAKWFQIIQTQKERQKIAKETIQLVLGRDSKMCNFLEYRDIKIACRRYASLYFICGIENTDNELLALEIIHRYVECLDKYFGNAYYILDEILLAGELQETSKRGVLRAINQSDAQQEFEAEDETLSKII